MRKMARTVLPFKLAATEAPMTAQSGLVFHGEFIQSLRSTPAQRSHPDRHPCGLRQLSGGSF